MKDMTKYNGKWKLFLAESREQTILYSGTSSTQFEKIEANNFIVSKLFLAEDEYKSDDYATMQSEEDQSVPVVMEILLQKLDRKNLEIDYGGGSGDSEYNMGQYIYSGDIKKALLNYKEIKQEIENWE